MPVLALMTLAGVILGGVAAGYRLDPSNVKVVRVDQGQSTATTVQDTTETSPLHDPQSACYDDTSCSAAESAAATDAQREQAYEQRLQNQRLLEQQRQARCEQQQEFAQSNGYSNAVIAGC